MKRIHNLIKLGKVSPGLEDNSDGAAVVTQPIEGQPTVASTDEVLSDEQNAAAAQQQADQQIPADGSIPSTEVPGVGAESDQGAGVTAPVATETNPELNNKVDTGDGSQPATPSDAIDNTAARADLGQQVSQESQEAGVVAPVATETTPALNNKVDTGDGSQPATPADAAGDPANRADIPASTEGKPAELAPELEQKVVTAPQTTSVAADPNNPDNDNLSGGAATPAQTTSTEKSEQNGAAAPANTTSTEKSAVSTEDLSPADLAQVATVAAAVGAATANGTPADTAAAEAVAEDGAIAGSAGAGTVSPAEIPTEPAATPATVDAAAQTAADNVASGPTGDTPPGPNAGDAAATPANAAQVTADLIAANPDTAAEIAQAIDTVADAAVAATQGTAAPTPEQTAQGEAQAQAADNAENIEQQTDATDAADGDDDDFKDEFDEANADRAETDEDLDDIDDVTDEVTASQESLSRSINLLCSLEDLVETALQNGGLSDDAAQMLQTVTDDVGDDQGIDDTDLGLESLEYADRKNATDYALGRLRYTREQLERELTVSQEGFFDLFKSANTKNREWVTKARKSVEIAKAAIKDPAKKATKTLAGIEDNESYVQGADRAAKLLGGVLDGYLKDLDRAIGQVNAAAAKLRDGDEDFDEAREMMATVTVPSPENFETKGSNQASGPLFGGTEIAFILDGRRSVAMGRKTKVSSQTEITGESAKSILNSADRLIGAMEVAQRYFDTVEKSINSAADRGTGKAVGMSMVFGVFSFFSSDFRRAMKRAFQSDNQEDKVAELRAGFELAKITMSATRKWVDAAVAAAEAVAG